MNERLSRAGTADREHPIRDDTRDLAEPKRLEAKDAK